MMIRSYLAVSPKALAAWDELEAEERGKLTGWVTAPSRSRLRDKRLQQLRLSLETGNKSGLEAYSWKEAILYFFLPYG